jgi:hypothetical protein
VKDATRRLVRLRAAGGLPGFTAEQHALPPPIWGGEASAPVGQGPARPVPGWVEAQAQQQQQRFEEKLAAATAARPPRSRVRVRDEDLLEAYHAVWMDVAQPRQLPAARAQQRREAERAAAAMAGAVAAAAPVGPAGTADDCTDALRALPPSQKAWCQKWRAIQDKQLPRPVRAFAWLLAHAALPCGGAKVAPFPADGEGLAERVCCSNAA